MTSNAGSTDKSTGVGFNRTAEDISREKALKALKDFSLPLSMSFRLFGALLSGALVTELVYYYSLTSYVIPVIVAVLFTLLHALIQAYVLTMLVSIFYGESTEPSHKKEKRKNNE